MKKTFCDICEAPVTGDFVKEAHAGRTFAGHHVGIDVTIRTDGDFCKDCLVDSILRSAIVTTAEDRQEKT